MAVPIGQIVSAVGSVAGKTGGGGGNFMGAVSKAGGSLTQATVGLATGIAGAVRAKKARKRLLRSIDQQMADNEAMYQRDYYGDYMSRSENQAALRNLRNLYTQHGNNAGASAVTGATNTQQATKAAAMGSALSDATAAIASNSSQARDRAMSRYANARNNYYGAKQDIHQGMMQNSAEMARQGFTSMGEGLASAVDAFGKK